MSRVPFPSLAALFEGLGSSSIFEQRGACAYVIGTVTQGDKAMISVTAPVGEVLNGRVSHRLDGDIGVQQNSRTLQVTLSGSPFVTYRVEPTTKSNRVTIVLNLRDDELVVPKTGGRHSWIEATILLPRSATWRLENPAAAIVPLVTLNQLVDRNVSTEATRARRDRKRQEKRAQAAAPTPPPVREEPVQQTAAPKKSAKKKAAKKKTAPKKPAKKKAASKP
ncbi:MAG: hypothetical protein ABIG34_02805 [Candidatus Peregrinibacteria bacterium]